MRDEESIDRGKEGEFVCACAVSEKKYVRNLMLNIEIAPTHPKPL